MDKQVILVTGASAGIGRECADRLQRSNTTVVAASRRAIATGPWNGLVMDVDSDESVRQGIKSILEQHGRLDAVIACAGWGMAGAVEDTPIGDAKALFETNFWGCVRVVQAALPIFRRQGNGRVILMSSIAGIIGLPYQGFYSASKFALEGYAEALAYEVKPFNIHVTLVEPGNFKTDFTANRRVVPVSGDDAYTPARDKAIAVMVNEEVNGADPRNIATLVAKLLKSPKPPRRASVGKLDERIGILGKRLIPYRIFERAAKASLGI